MDFTYNNFKIEGAKFKISPSSIGKFFEYPSVWFKEFLQGEREFIASTSTVLGTIIHALAESYAKDEKHSKEECDAYADKMQQEIPEVDAELIKSLYPNMASLLINDYVRHNKPTISEEQVYTEVKDGIYVGGSCDAFYHTDKRGGMVLDYKTAGSKPNTETIPFHYKIQALAYAYCYRAMGYEVDRIRIVYTVRPTKTLPERLFTVTNEISEDDWKLIEDTLELIADSLLFCEQNPSAIPLIFKSKSLEGQTINLKEHHG